VQRLVSGDAEAWQVFVRRFGRLVLTRVEATAHEVNQALTQPDAEDLCAEVFSQLVAGDYGVLRRFEGRSTLSTWLCVVTRRIAIRRLVASRREPSRATAQTPQPIESLPAANDQDPLKILIGGEDRAQLSAAVAKLGERHRQLACLFYIDGCSYLEISRKLEMPINSIGPTLARIQDKLRAAMKEEE
jgi:RNA polymerase sigma-70 factor (ECF subfamily)